MPICYGEQFIHTALDGFIDQDYDGEMELVVLDNNTEPHIIRYLDVWTDIKYLRTTRKPVGALRNEAIRAATWRFRNPGCD